jgi:hypothetical protein
MSNRSTTPAPKVRADLRLLRPESEAIRTIAAMIGNAAARRLQARKGAK